MTPRQTLDILTYNVWFAPHHYQTRRRAILALLRDSRADMICLQEVRPRFVERDQHWPMTGYVCSLAHASDLGSYGTLMLVRAELQPVFSVHELPTAMGRKLVVAQCRINGHSVVVATVHLESLDNQRVREAQLQVAADVLAREPGDAILVGDFNFCSYRNYAGRGPLENDCLARTMPDHVDVWPTLRPEEPGYTFDIEVNTMLRRPRRDAQMRYDRVLSRRAGRWQPERVRLVGDRPVEDGIFPSDHFGIHASFAWSPTNSGER